MRVAVLIDGGHLRVLARKAGHTYDPDFIDAFAHNCVLPTERIVRILYYDCPSYRGVAKRPVSGTEISFDGSDLWLVELGEKELFAIRRGVLKFRGFKARKLPIAP